ncbi:hypothetical protein AKO1_006116 [Acrasis kona]|uniref:Fibronectin type-III domain-containing protein n=1 Tax=Acrasis kona TaxID=1008807 RepID=A0AAW2YGY3_9EUKA
MVSSSTLSVYAGVVLDGSLQFVWDRSHLTKFNLDALSHQIIKSNASTVTGAFKNVFDNFNGKFTPVVEYNSNFVTTKITPGPCPHGCQHGLCTNSKCECFSSFIGVACNITTSSKPNLYSTFTGRNSVNLKWDAPKYDGGSPIIGYALHRNDVIVQSFKASVRSYLDDSLVYGTSYYYALYAINDAGAGQASDRITISLVDVPGAITSINTHLLTNVTIGFAWNKPEQSSTSQIMYYVLSDDVSYVGTDDRCTFDNLIPNKQYKFSFFAENQLGNGSATHKQVVTLSYPDDPIDLLSDSTDSSIKLMWSPPTFTGNCILSGYDVYRDDILIENVKHIGNQNTFSASNSDLNSNTPYVYKVQSVNKIGASRGVKVLISTKSKNTISDFNVTIIIVSAFVVVIVATFLIAVYAFRCTKTKNTTIVRATNTFVADDFSINFGQDTGDETFLIDKENKPSKRKFF